MMSVRDRSAGVTAEAWIARLPNPARESSAVMTSWRYSLHGLDVEVTADDAALAARLHPIFEHLGLLPAPDPPEWGHPADVTLRYSASARGCDAPPGARRVAEQDGITAWSCGGALFLDCDGHGARLELCAGRAECVVPHPPAALRKDLIVYTLLLLLRRQGLYALHASGVSRAGAGYLFAAPSGSGKSTHTYGLARQGWAYLGDDVLLLRAGGTTVEALALRRDLCLDPALEHAFPEVLTQGEAGPLAGKGKRLLAMRTLRPAQLVDHCAPRVLVFPEIVAHHTSRLEPVTPAEALVQLAAESAVLALDRETISGHFELLGRLARQARGYRLLAGRDLRQRPTAVAGLLAGIHPLRRSHRTG